MRIHLFIPFAFLLLPTYILAQYPGIDSIKIKPLQPNVNDTITAYAYVVTANDAVKYDETINIFDTSILVSSCYLQSLDASQGWYTDTIVLGILGAGNYTMQYRLKQPTYTVIDSPAACRAFHYYDSAYFHFTVLGTTAVNEIFSNKSLNIYPNPVNDKIEINFKNQQLGLGDVSILNISGQTLIKEQSNLNGKRELNTENLPPGMYFLVLQDEKQHWVRKFVKE